MSERKGHSWLKVSDRAIAAYVGGELAWPLQAVVRAILANESDAAPRLVFAELADFVGAPDQESVELHEPLEREVVPGSVVNLVVDAPSHPDHGDIAPMPFLVTEVEGQLARVAPVMSELHAGGRLLTDPAVDVRSEELVHAGLPSTVWAWATGWCFRRQCVPVPGFRCVGVARSATAAVRALGARDVCATSVRARWEAIERANIGSLAYSAVAAAAWVAASSAASACSDGTVVDFTARLRRSPRPATAILDASTHRLAAASAGASDRLAGLLANRSSDAVLPVPGGGVEIRVVIADGLGRVELQTAATVRIDLLILARDDAPPDVLCRDEPILGFLARDFAVDSGPFTLVVSSGGQTGSYRFAPRDGA